MASKEDLKQVLTGEDAPTAGIPSTIWTIGHSVRSAEEFLALLNQAGIQLVADVRSFPGSRKFPHYGREALKETLAARAIGYHWLPALGGRRKARPDSPNVAWRNASFRGYADHMSSPDFAHGLSELLDISSRARTAIMCSEAVWWRCHRAMIADALSSRGLEVVHILGATHSVIHPMTAPARVVQGVLSYHVGEPEQSK
jgi:uncharacterized protein (DUF488 family)